MLSRSLAMPALLAASVAVPYVATNAPEWSERVRRPAGAGLSASASPNSAIPPASGAGLRPTLPQGPGALLYPTQTPLEGIPTHSLNDVFRLDVTKDWVYQRWARKSTALSELDLYGVRVPLVTGTKLHDLAGSLTYFFRQDGRLQRISFRGRTGDTTQLLTLLAQRHGFQAHPTVVAGEQLLQVRRGEEVISELRTRPAPVLWSSSPHDSFSVELELQDPATARPLKPLATPSPIAARVPPKPAAEAPAVQASAQQAEDVAEAKKKEPPWSSFFPRSRISKPQAQNLDSGGIYQ